MGDLSAIRNCDSDDEFDYIYGSGLDIENWKSFHRRFGTKPKKPTRSSNRNGNGLYPIRRRRTTTHPKKHEDTIKDGGTLWSSMIHAVKGCSNPMCDASPVVDDEWLHEVLPTQQRDGILDIRRHENGKWHFLEDASAATDAEYHLTE